jgi:hypothetical protein
MRTEYFSGQSPGLSANSWHIHGLTGKTEGVPKPHEQYIQTYPLHCIPFLVIKTYKTSKSTMDHTAKRNSTNTNLHSKCRPQHCLANKQGITSTSVNLDKANCNICKQGKYPVSFRL